MQLRLRCKAGDRVVQRSRACAIFSNGRSSLSARWRPTLSLFVQRPAANGTVVGLRIREFAYPKVRFQMYPNRRSTNRPGFRFGIRRLLFASAFCAMVFAVMAFVYSSLNSALSNVKDFYALDWASGFVVQHLAANDNRWPTSWDELRDEYDDTVKIGHVPAVTWEELTDRVEIDWNADAKMLAEATDERDQPFPVIRLSGGSSTQWEVLDVPNWKVLNYLRNAENDAK